jgi:hypothetical protein
MIPLPSLIGRPVRDSECHTTALKHLGTCAIVRQKTTSIPLNALVLQAIPDASDAVSILSTIAA